MRERQSECERKAECVCIRRCTINDTTLDNQSMCVLVITLLNTVVSIYKLST